MDAIITAKLPQDRAGRARETLSASLAALDTEYVDLWLIHWPPGGAASPETWRALVAARHEGRIRAIEVSNHSIAQIDELIESTGEAPAVNQVKWSPSLHDPVELAAHHERGNVLEDYSPFKSTSLRHPTLVEIANGYGVTPAQVVVRWHVQHRIVVSPKRRGSIASRPTVTSRGSSWTRPRWPGTTGGPRDSVGPGSRQGPCSRFLRFHASGYSSRRCTHSPSPPSPSPRPFGTRSM